MGMGCEQTMGSNALPTGRRIVFDCVPDFKTSYFEYHAMRVHAHEEIIMNRNIKQIINKYSYHRGIDYGQNLRTELIEKAKGLEKQGKTPEEIVCALALPISYLTTKSAVEMEKLTINQQSITTSRRPTST